MFDDSEVDPSVDFLYKTMLSRDPNKRRVKPVQKHLVQVDFAGLEDSDEDSDFDITEEPDVSDDSEIFSNESANVEKLEKAESVGCISDGDIEILEEPHSEKTQTKMMFNSEEPVEIDDDDDNEDDDDDDNDDDESNDAADDDDDDDDDDEDDDDMSDDDDSDDEDDEDEDEMSSPIEKSAFSHHLISMDISDDEDDTDYVPKKMRRKKKKENIVQEKESISLPEQTSAKPVSSSTPYEKPKNLKVVICCVCLGDISQNEDEIVECDNCGVSVHEGCYGVNESQSAASTESSASTEPWFCDSCKAGVTPQCELCPNEGGIYKETDAGKWVHLVCALYTPGVAFGDVDRLSPVTLFEMPYSRWASKECSLCEDPRFSRTGVCIGCDAGMCRIYFHVTCAQREGLLSEASPEEVMDIADPFFAYCKMHADKNMMRIKRRNWLAVQSRVKKHAEQVLDDEKEKIRFNRKLNRHREKYRISRANRQPSWVPTQKMVRFLHSCPSAVKRMLKKAELMGIITSVQHESHEKQENRKKSYISPAFTPEFIAYYLERNVKLENLRSSAKDLELQSKKLYEQEKVLRARYDKLCAEIDKLKESSSKTRKEGEKIWNMLSNLSRKPVSVPEIVKPKKIKSPTRRDVPMSPPAAVIHQCGICKKTNDQHMLAKCDECKLFYHLGCLEPPLTRLPKKTKLFGWQCSRCAKVDNDEPPESKNLDCDAPRQLREKRRMPFKFTPPHIQEYNFKMITSKSKKKTNSQNIQKQNTEPEQKSSEKEKKPAYDIKGTSLVSSHKPPVKGPPAKPVKKQEKIEPTTIASSTKITTTSSTSEPAHATRSLRKRSGIMKSEILKQDDTPPSIEKIKSTSFSVSQMVSQIVQSAEEDQEEAMFSTPSIGVDSYLTECIVCNRPGKNNVNMVRCDECKLFYHFLCLIPPVRKNPKPRGYTWHCEACDQTDLMETEKGNEDDAPPTKVSPKSRLKHDRRAL